MDNPPRLYTDVISYDTLKITNLSGYSKSCNQILCSKLL